MPTNRSRIGRFEASSAIDAGDLLNIAKSTPINESLRLAEYGNSGSAILAAFRVEDSNGSFI
jgi:hypothetical protein